MKRCIVILLALLLLAACGTGGQAPVQEKESSPSSLSESASANPSSEPSSIESEPEAGGSPAAGAPEQSAPDQPSGESETNQEDDPLYFRAGPEGEVKALRAGDTLGGWTLQSYNAVWDNGPDSIPRVYEADFIAPADAPVEMNCTVYLNPMSWEDRVYCFDVALEDWDKLPVLEGTDRSIWFRAGNSDQLEQLETMDYEDRWECRVAVSRYNYSHLPMAAADIAEIAWLELR